MSKLKAFATHFGISLVIFAVILYLIIFHWYPEPFFHSDGGWQGIRIIAGVDLVLGPLLTLIVYKQGKAGLKLDLTIIGLIQAGALAWGIWAVYHERPIATVFVEGYFATVPADDAAQQGMTTEKLRSFGTQSPYWIYSDLPEDLEVMQKIRIRALQSGRPVYLLTDYYKPIDDDVIDKIRRQALDMQEILTGRQDDVQKYRDFINKHPQKSLVFLPWHSRYSRKIVALEAEKLRYVGSLEIRPPRVDAKSRKKPAQKENGS